MQSVTQIENDFKETTMDIQNQARIIIIIVALGCIIACATIIGVLSWHLKHPALVSYATALMLFFVFVVLLVGSGIARSGETLSNDACLYAETYAATLLIDRIDDPGKRTWWKRAIIFYLNPERPPPDAPYSALNEVTGVDINDILDILQSPEVASFLGLVGSPTVQRVLTLSLQPATIQAVNNITLLVQPIVNTSKLSLIYVCLCTDAALILFCMQLSKI